MNTSSKILSISLLLSCSVLSTYGAAEPTEPTAVTTTGKKFQREQELSKKVSEYLEVTAARRSSIDRFTQEIAGIEAEQPTLIARRQSAEQEKTTQIAALMAAKAELDRVYAERIAQFNAEKSAAEQKYATTAGEIDAQLASLSNNKHGLEQNIAARQQVIASTQAKTTDAQQRIQRLKEGKSENGGLLGLGVLGL